MCRTYRVDVFRRELRVLPSENIVVALSAQGDSDTSAE